MPLAGAGEAAKSVLCRSAFATLRPLLNTEPETTAAYSEAPRERSRKATGATRCFCVIAAGPRHDYLVVIPVQLEYVAPSGCPTEAEFVAAVARRGCDFVHPAPTARARAMFVTLRRSSSDHQGSLQLQFDGSTSDARQVRAEHALPLPTP